MVKKMKTLPTPHSGRIQNFDMACRFRAQETLNIQQQKIEAERQEAKVTAIYGLIAVIATVVLIHLLPMLGK